MKQEINKGFRLLIQVEDKSKPRIVREGIEYMSVKWIEMTEVNLGSISKPSRICKKILAMRIEPR